MRTYAIYDRPRDFPNHVVVRPWLSGPGNRLHAHFCVCLCASLDEARATCAQLALIPIPRDPNDDPCIVEVWL